MPDKHRLALCARMICIIMMRAETGSTEHPFMERHLQLGDLKRTCSRCSLQQLCLPYGLESADIEHLEQVVSPANPIARERELFAQGDRLTAIYAIRGGSLKTVLVNEDGLEQVMGFYYPGDVLGLDGLADQRHRCSAVALENASVCRIPFDRLDELVDRLPSLRRQIMRLMSQALSEDEQLLLTLGRKSSEARIATLLLNLSRRREARNASPDRVVLSMSRSDLANFLGMRVETVSRVLHRLQGTGVIRVNRREVEIHNHDILREWASRGAWVADQ